MTNKMPSIVTEKISNIRRTRGPDGDVRIEGNSGSDGVRWYGHVLRRDDGHVLRKALKFEVRGKRKRGHPKTTWKMQVEKSVGLEKKDAMNRASWRVEVRAIAAGVNPATHIYGDKPRSKLDC